MRLPFWKISITFFLLLAFYAFDYQAARAVKLFKPMDLPNVLSGTFGELRGGHFHAGIDIKTTGRTGFPIKSIEKGYVSRIKVSPYGYGKAVYVDHPNGLTSVYAHVEDFSPKIRLKVYELMRENKSNELNHYFEADEIPIESKETIAYSGNTGGSMGPHLHFELRESALQIPVNPLLYSYKIEDKKAPVINDVFFYNLEDNMGIEKATRLPSLKMDTLKFNSSIIGLSVSAYDQQDGNYNRNGVYSIDVHLDSSLVFSFRMDKISYSESRYIQAHSDQNVKEKFHQKVHRCFILPGDELSIYNQVENSGEINLESGKTHFLELTVRDINGNRSIRKWWIQKDGKSDFFNTDKTSVENQIAVNYRQSFDREGENWIINIPQNAFYYNTYLSFEEVDTIAPNIIGNKLKVHSNHFDTHRKFTLSLGNESRIKHPEKAVIVRETDGEYKFLTTYYKNGIWWTKSRSFGNYFLVMDTTKPELLKIAPDLDEKKVRIYAKDTQSGIVDYHAFINGEWSICYYDAKNDAFEIDCKECFEQSGTELVLQLSDEKNNILFVNKKFN
jgi:hypothetical protein